MEGKKAEEARAGRSRKIAVNQRDPEGQRRTVRKKGEARKLTSHESRERDGGGDEGLSTSFGGSKRRELGRSQPAEQRKREIESQEEGGGSEL